MTNQQQVENKAIIRRLYNAFNAGDADALEALLAEDLINHNPWMSNGRAAAQAALRQVGTMKVDVLQMVADGDLVAIYGHYKTPTEGAGMDFYKLKDGQVIEHWDVRQEITPPNTTVPVPSAS